MKMKIPSLPLSIAIISYNTIYNISFEKIILVGLFITKKVRYYMVWHFLILIYVLKEWNCVLGNYEHINVNALHCPICVSSNGEPDKIRMLKVWPSCSNFNRMCRNAYGRWALNGGLTQRVLLNTCYIFSMRVNHIWHPRFSFKTFFRVSSITCASMIHCMSRFLCLLLAFVIDKKREW